MSKLNWRTEKRKVGDLIFFENNPRKMSAKQASELLKSLKKFNLVEIPVIDQNNRVIAGNMRIQALKQLGKEDEEIEVRVPDRPLTEDEAIEYLLRSNKNTGDWDFDLLANFDENLLKDVGFDSDQLDEIFGLKADDESDDEKEDDEKEFDVEKELNELLKTTERRVKDGDVWQLGEHRLLIGDCTKKESWEKLLKDERFDYLLTDPPYRLSWLKAGEGFGANKQRKYLGTIKMGRFPEYDEWLSMANKFQNPNGANIMVFENWRNTVELWQAMEKYWKIRNMIIWWVPNRHHGFSVQDRYFNKYDIAPLGGDGVLNKEYEKELEDYLIAKGQKLLDTYEVIIYSGNGKKKSNQTNVSDHITWTAETTKSSGQDVIYGTKPVQVLVPYIKALSPRDGIVLDCFGGSGSTLIACETMKRRCRMIEIEPIYGEVILRRWEKFTGKKAIQIEK